MKSGCWVCKHFYLLYHLTSPALAFESGSLTDPRTGQLREGDRSSAFFCLSSTGTASVNHHAWISHTGSGTQTQAFMFEQHALNQPRRLSIVSLLNTVDLLELPARFHM